MIRGYDVVAGDISSETYYYQLDEQFSTSFITNQAQKIVNSYTYDAFGNTLESQEQVHNRIRYTGQQYDAITQQYYLRARFYNPILGRFMQEDVYRGDGLNLYAYCENNPVMYYDPSGYKSKRAKSKRLQYMGKTPSMTKSTTGKQTLQNTYNMNSLDISGVSDVNIQNALSQPNGFLTTKIDSKTKSEIKFYSEKLDVQTYGVANKQQQQHPDAWISLDEGNMAHKIAAVDAWNEGGTKYNNGKPLKETGAKSPAVRDFMKDSSNYEIESASINKSEGGQMKKTYDPPSATNNNKNKKAKGSNDTGKCP